MYQGLNTAMWWVALNNQPPCAARLPTDGTAAGKLATAGC